MQKQAFVCRIDRGSALLALANVTHREEVTRRDRKLGVQLLWQVVIQRVWRSILATSRAQLQFPGSQSLQHGALD